MKKCYSTIGSFIKIHVIVFGILGLLAGILYSFGGLAIDILISLEWITTTETPGLSYGTILAFGALIGMPLIGIALGLVTGVISGIVYAIIARCSR